MGRTADLTAAQMIITDILNKQAQKEPAEKELTQAVDLESSVRFLQSGMMLSAVSPAAVGGVWSKVNTAVYQEILEHFMEKPTSHVPTVCRPFH